MFDLATIIPLFAAAFATVLVLLTLVREHRSLTAWLFSLGLLLVAAEVALGTLGWRVATPEEFQAVSLLRFYIMALIPGFWVGFGLCFARDNAIKASQKHRAILSAAFLAPLVCVTLLRGALFNGPVDISPTDEWFAPFGLAGIGIHICLLIGWIIALIHLERTIRASVGIIRWQLKYFMLGVVTILVGCVYASTQAILFRSTSSTLVFVKGAALLIGCVSVAFSFRRTRPFKINVYPSQVLLSGSVVAILAGTYLLMMGAFAQVVTAWGGDAAFPLKAFLALLSFFGLGVLFMSERFRHNVQHWVSRHMRRSIYDYRNLWMTFTEKTSAAVDDAHLSRAVSKWICETFNVLSVSIWLFDDLNKQLRLGASTCITDTEAEALLATHQASSSPTPGRSKLHPVNADFVRFMSSQPPVIDLDSQAGSGPWIELLQALQPRNFPKGGHRLCVPLLKDKDLVGFVTVGDRVHGTPYSVDDFDFLKCVGNQLAARLHHLQLSRQLLSAREMATFQTVSAFFVHDLKNTASTLSLMLQNLPVHFSDPNFREDALRAISKSAGRINELIERLSSLRQHNDIRKVPTDLQAWIQGVVKSLVCRPGIAIATTFDDLPPVLFDPEQMQKVLTNLVLNACDACGESGRITVAVHSTNGWAAIRVQDDGAGMSPEFIKNSLFRPFQTTKKKGIGIGLFHVKMIVEAHAGKIEVESEKGRGTAFTILLPLTKE